MEKSIHTLLFTSAVSSKEHRLLGFSAGGFENDINAEETKKEIEKKLKEEQDPAVEAEANVLAIEAGIKYPAIKTAILQMLTDRSKATADYTELKRKNTEKRDTFKKDYNKTGATDDEKKALVSGMKTEIDDTLTALSALENPPTGRISVHTDGATKQELLKHIKEIQNTQGLDAKAKDVLLNKFTTETATDVERFGRGYLEAEGGTKESDIAFKFESSFTPGPQLDIKYEYDTSGEWVANIVDPANPATWFAFNVTDMSAVLAAPPYNVAPWDDVDHQAYLNRQIAIFDSIKKGVNEQDPDTVDELVAKINETEGTVSRTALEKSKTDQKTFLEGRDRLRVATELDAARKLDQKNPANKAAVQRLEGEMKQLYTDRKNEVTATLQGVLSGHPSNLVAHAELLKKQMMDLDDGLDAELGIVRKTPAAGPATAADKPLENQEKAAIKDLEAGIIDNDEPKQKKALEEWNTKGLTPDQLSKKAEQINAELAKNSKVDKQVKVEGGKLVVADKAPAGSINSKEKEDLNTFLEAIKKFLIWLTNFERQNKIANGDLNAMRNKSAELGLQINKIKANPDFATDPALKKEYADLTAEKDALDAQIKEVEAKNKTAVADINAKVNQAAPGTCPCAANLDKAGQMYVIGAQPQIAYIAQQCGGQPFVAQAINGVPTYATYINKGNVSIGGSNYGNINTGSNNKNMQTQGNNDVGNSRVDRGAYRWPYNVDARYRLPGYRGTFYG